VDSQQTHFVLPVEFVGSLPAFPGFTQVVVKLPDGIVSAGDLQVTITVRGKTSNLVLVGVTPCSDWFAALPLPCGKPLGFCPGESDFAASRAESLWGFVLAESLW